MLHGFVCGGSRVIRNFSVFHEEVRGLVSPETQTKFASIFEDAD
jgi:hypothetical protein